MSGELNIQASIINNQEKTSPTRGGFPYTSTAVESISFKTRAAAYTPQFPPNTEKETPFQRRLESIPTDVDHVGATGRSPVCIRLWPGWVMNIEIINLPSSLLGKKGDLVKYFACGLAVHQDGCRQGVRTTINTGTEACATRLRQRLRK